MKKRSRNLVSVLLMAMAVLRSCGSSVDGYKFSGDGLMGSIPEARAKAIGIYKEETAKVEKKLKDENFDEMGIERYEKIMEERANIFTALHDRLGDDARQALVEDMKRIDSGKDFPLVNKTTCKMSAMQPSAVVDTAHALGGYILVKLAMDPSKRRILSEDRLYYLTKSAEGTVLTKGEIDDIIPGNDYNYNFAIGANGYKLEFVLSENDIYDKQMHYLMSLDSIASVEIVDYATYFDYTTERATTEGVGPVKIGAKIDDMPDSCSLYVYKEPVNVMQPDMTVCEFQDKHHATLFTAVGDGKGKIKSIDVERLPIKLDGKVVSTHVYVRDAVENLKDVAEWSFDQEAQDAVASFEGGKVTISLGSNVFNESGFAKYQQLQKGAKGIKFDYNDFNDYDTFEMYMIKGKLKNESK